MSRVTVKALADSYLDGRKDLSERTAELYRYLTASYIIPELGSVPIARLTPSAVRSWHAAIAERHPTTAAKAYRLLSSMMASAVADRILGVSPCQVSGAGAERAPERPVASIAEVEALAAAMPEHLGVAVLLASWCQLRRGELLGLRRCDVDPLHRTLSVCETRTRTMRGDVITKAPKTDAGTRTLAIPANILGAVEDHLERFVGPQPTAPFLVGAKGDALTPNVLFTAFDRARRKIGRTDLVLHDLRHSCLTWAAATGHRRADAARWPRLTGSRHPLPARHGRPRSGAR